MDNIGIFGVGRLGLCFALLCEQAGYTVVGADVRDDYVDSLNRREITTCEPEVQRLLTQTINLKATTDSATVINSCNTVFVFVATPSLPDGSYDVSAVWSVVDNFKEVVAPKVLVIGCTVNPGDCDKFQAALPANIQVVYNPEFIAQGSIISDLRKADMILIGCVDAVTANSLVELYTKIQTTSVRPYVMSPTAAEVTKIAINCFLTTKISYANMVGDVLHQVGCGEEVDCVLAAIGTDSRIGRQFLKYGFGYGGPCLPRDNRAFAAFSKQIGQNYTLGEIVDNLNADHARFLCDLTIARNKDNLPFYFNYITYKEGTDILTESQQLQLFKDLLDRGHKVYLKADSRIESYYSTLLSKYPNLSLVSSLDDINTNVIKVI